MNQSADPSPSRGSLGRLLIYFLKLGATGFGGPIALIGCMRQDLVEDRGWISAADFTQGLAFSEMAPGPVAAQLAIYLGYVHSGFGGATLVSLFFILPSFLMVIAIAAFYAQYGGLTAVHSLFYGVGAAALAIIVKAAYRLTRSSTGKKGLLWMIYIFTAAATVATRKPNVLLFLAAGGVSLWAYAPPARLRRARLGAFVPAIGLMAPAGRAAASWDALGAIFLTFAKAGSFVFGSGFAIIPFLYGDVVRRFHWLTDRQFLDAVAVAMLTPGPAVITVGFIGYLIGGLAGAVLAALGAFLPVYLFVIVIGPWFRRNSDNAGLTAFSEGITAAAIGAMSGSVLILAREAIYDVPTMLIFIASLFTIARLRIPDPLVIFAAAVSGFLLNGK